MQDQDLEYKSFFKIRLFLTTVILFLLPIGLGHISIINYIKEYVRLISEVTLCLSIFGFIIYYYSVTWKQLAERFVPYGYLNWMCMLFSLSLGGVQNSMTSVELVLFLAAIIFVIILLYSNRYVHNNVYTLCWLMIVYSVMSVAISAICFMYFLVFGDDAVIDIDILCISFMGLIYVLYPFKGAYQLCCGSDCEEWRRIMFGVTSLWIANILSHVMYKCVCFFLNVAV